MKAQLSTKFDEILQLTTEGENIISNIYEMVGESGKPAFIIRNLPEQEGVREYVFEAFRSFMGDAHSKAFDYLEDHDKFTAPFKGGLHHDNADYVGIFCVSSGVEKRSTIVITVDELLTEMAKEEIAGKGSNKSEEVINALKESYIEQLTKPYWYKAERNYDPLLSIKSKCLKVVKADPLLIFHGNNHLVFKPVPFQRSQIVSDAPEEAKKVNELYNKFCQEGQCYGKLSGETLQSGDLMLFNERLVMHAGSPPPLIDSNIDYTTNNDRTLIAFDVIKDKSRHVDIDSCDRKFRWQEYVESVPHRGGVYPRK